MEDTIRLSKTELVKATRSSSSGRAGSWKSSERDCVSSLNKGATRTAHLDEQVISLAC